MFKAKRGRQLTWRRRYRLEDARSSLVSQSNANGARSMRDHVPKKARWEARDMVRWLREPAVLEDDPGPIPRSPGPGL